MQEYALTPFSQVPGNEMQEKTSNSTKKELAIERGVSILCKGYVKDTLDMVYRRCLDTWFSAADDGKHICRKYTIIYANSFKMLVFSLMRLLVASVCG